MPDATTVHVCTILSSTAFGAMFLALWLIRDRGLFYLLCGAGPFTYAFVLAGLALPDRGVAMSFMLCVGLGLYNSWVLAAVRRFEDVRMLDIWTIGPPLMSGVAYGAFAVFGEIETGRIANSVVLVGSNLAVALILLRTRGSAAPRSRLMLGLVLLAYVPSSVVSIVLDLSSAMHADWLALIPLLSDQLLLGMLNIALLAMPGERAEAALRDAVMRDPLTGAWNRAGLNAIERTLRLPATVILLDIDHFKQINDRHGHAAGDAVLVTLAREAMACLPASGHLIRLGGDEFVAILPGNGDLDAAKAVAERFRAIRLPQPDCTISLGLARVGGDVADLSEALSHADAMLYRAKSAGRDRLVAWSPDGDDRVVGRLGLSRHGVARAGCCAGADEASGCLIPGFEPARFIPDPDHRMPERGI